MIKQFVLNMLNKHLPKKTKRQVFLTSFAARLKGATAFDNETFHKLNTVLALSETGPDAMKLPVLLSKAIWNGKTTYEICKENVCEGPFSMDRISQIVTSILETMPFWLQYGDEEEMRTDVGTILTERRHILGA